MAWQCLTVEVQGCIDSQDFKVDFFTEITIADVVILFKIYGVEEAHKIISRINVYPNQEITIGKLRYEYKEAKAKLKKL